MDGQTRARKVTKAVVVIDKLDKLRRELLTLTTAEYDLLFSDAVFRARDECVNTADRLYDALIAWEERAINGD
jgi:hypothetical protein